MNAPLASDEALLARIRAHDQHALTELVRKHYAPLCKFARSLLRRPELADEAVSTAFLNVWRLRESLVIKTTLRNYLIGAVSNQSLNLMESQARRQTHLVPLTDTPEEKLQGGQTADAELLYREFQAEIEALLLGMPAQRQAIFRMNRFENLRYKEIAQSLGIAERTVQNHMVEAVRQLAASLPRLRALLKGDGPAPG